MINYLKQLGITPRWNCCQWHRLPVNHVCNALGLANTGVTTRWRCLLHRRMPARQKRRCMSFSDAINTA